MRCKMKVVRFFTRKEDSEVEVSRVWAEDGKLCGTGSEIFLADLHQWYEVSGETLEEYLEGLHLRFDGDFLYAGRYQESNEC